MQGDNDTCMELQGVLLMSQSFLFSNSASCAVQLQSFKTWLAAKLKQQGKLSADKPAAVTSQEVNTQVDALRKPFNKLKNKKKPPPPPAPAAEAANATAANGMADAEDRAEETTEDRAGQPEAEADSTPPTGEL